MEVVGVPDNLCLADASSSTNGGGLACGVFAQAFGNFCFLPSLIDPRSLGAASLDTTIPGIRNISTAGGQDDRQNFPRKGGSICYLIMSRALAQSTRHAENVMANKLEGKVAVVTGGSTGIGLATAKRFAEEGAYVFITGRRQPELDAAVKEIGPKAVAVRADSSDVADLAHLFDTVKAAKGRIDVLFANAGVYEFTPLGTITEETYDKMFDINVKGVLFTVQQAVPLMADGGSIILTGSVAGSKGFEAGTVYSATKAAIRSFARSWTSDLKVRNIRVNVVSPGPIQTPGFDVFANPDVKNYMKSLVPLGRIGTSDEIAKAALFLASDDSSFVAGIELFVDGGSAAI
jgi:NAD(P)-dependent dehydrogenase (short-subunit alcohol dehydrogenase family)